MRLLNAAASCAPALAASLPHLPWPPARSAPPRLCSFRSTLTSRLAASHPARRPRRRGSSSAQARLARGRVLYDCATAYEYCVICSSGVERSRSFEGVTRSVAFALPQPIAAAESTKGNLQARTLLIALNLQRCWLAVRRRRWTMPTTRPILYPAGRAFPDWVARSLTTALTSLSCGYRCRVSPLSRPRATSRVRRRCDAEEAGPVLHECHPVSSAPRP